jgi:pimeloyl-ACP methyl ester carboxylesterase
MVGAKSAYSQTVEKASQAREADERMAELQEARCPVMLLRGAEDYFIQDDVYTETIEALPDVEHLVLEDVGHYPMMEIPDQITELIHEFD